MHGFRLKRKNSGGRLTAVSRNKKNATVSDRVLTAIFAEVGLKYGYDDVTAKFVDFGDFKIRWQRQIRGWAEFSVSDYLDRASEDVLRNLAEAIFQRICGAEKDYGEDLCDYLLSPEIMRDNRADYAERNGLSGSAIGKFHDLNDCVERLRQEELIPYDLECILEWRPGDGLASSSSVFTRTAWVSTELDQKGVPEHVLDYAVFHALSRLMVRPPTDERFFEETDRIVSSYPMRDEAIAWLVAHGYML